MRQLSVRPTSADVFADSSEKAFSTLHNDRNALPFFSFFLFSVAVGGDFYPDFPRRFELTEFPLPT